MASKPALRDVSNVNNWHFAMLNDVDRNAKFDLAIREAVAALAPEVGRVRVLDLGAGSGLLSMMAARAGADKVYAVERSALLFAQPVIKGRVHVTVKINRNYRNYRKMILYFIVFPADSGRHVCQTCINHAG